MKAPGLAALVAFVVSCLVAAPAGAATVSPGIVVVNHFANTLTSYPLSARDDTAPEATLGTGSTPSSDPLGVALDSAGSAWVTKLSSNSIVEYSKAELAAGGDPTPLATITTTNGSLNGPAGAAFDAAGDLWVSNSGSNTIVEYSAGQLASGGAQTPTVTLGSDSSNSLSSPYLLDFDAAGNLWVPNNGNGTLVEFTRDQLSVSGDPTPAVTISSDSSNDLNAPASITFDAAGDLWTADPSSDSILEYTPAQLLTGAPTPRTVLHASFPAQGAFDAAGDLWVSEPLADTVVEFDPAQLAAGGSPTPVSTIRGGDTGLNDPAGIAVEQAPTVSSISVNGGPGGTTVPISGTGFYPGSTVRFGGAVATSVTYVSPYQLRAKAPAGTGMVDVTVTTGQGTSMPSQGGRFTYGAAPTTPPSLVIGNDSGPGGLISFPLSASGNVAPATTVGDNSPVFPIDGALDGAGNLWLPDDVHSVVEYTKSQIASGGAQTPAVTITSDSSSSLDQPAGAAFDADGNLWVCNEGTNTVVEYTKSQLTSGGALVPVVTLSADSAGSLAGCAGLDFDASGNLWVANFDPNAAGNYNVVEYSKTQLAASGAPTPAVTVSADGAQSLATPDALTFDRQGDLWVTNGFLGNSVVEYTPSQLTTGSPVPAVTINSDAAGSLNGSDQAQFDAAGNLWVADFRPGSDPAYEGSVVEYTPAQLASSGSPTPADTIGGDATGLNNPWTLVIEQAPTVSGVSPTRGPAGGGTTVTISGTGFYPGSTVRFGGASATSVTYVSPYELTAVAPAGSGTVDVAVSTGEGSSAISPADQFTYATAPLPPAPGSGAVHVPRVGSAAHQLKVTGRQAAVTLTCSFATCRGTARLTQRVVVTTRRGHRVIRHQKTIVIGTAHYTIKAGHRVTVKLKLSNAALGELAHARQHRVNARLTLTVAGGRTLTRNVVLVMVGRRHS